MVTFFSLPLQTFVRREVMRFMNVGMQTLLAPLITAGLFFAIFILALGQDGRIVAGLPYAAFLAPGLIMMSMLQNAFANSSSSLIIGKVQGTLTDILMAPLTPLQMLTGYVLGATLRGLAVGAVCMIVLIPLMTQVEWHAIAILWYAVQGCILMGALGVLAGLWADKFDHMAAITNFVIAPLTFLSGTFYDIRALPEGWGILAHMNPIFYLIDGFRFGLTGMSESSLITGSVIVTLINIALCVFAWRLMVKGYKIRQ